MVSTKDRVITVWCERGVVHDGGKYLNNKLLRLSTRGVGQREQVREEGPHGGM